MSFVKALMTGGKSRSMRVQDDFELDQNHTTAKDDDMTELTQKGTREDANGKIGGCLKTEGLYRVFSEDYEGVKRSILDPRGTVARRWNELFLAAGLVSLFVDPLFLFLPKVRPELCIETGISLEKVLTNIRSVSDVFYWINIVIQFRTAYIAPSSRVIGRGELVIDPWKIAYRYRLRFLIDLLAALPFPQVLNWVVIPAVHRSAGANSIIALRFTIILQFLLRLFLLYPLSSKLINETGKITQTAWVGAAYNMILFYVASNVSGACWYLLTIERQEACWRSVCDTENQTCVYGFFDCRMMNDPSRDAWFQLTNVTNLCDPSNNYYEWGIFGMAVSNGAPSSVFSQKYFYCMWWGLQSLASIGNNLATTSYVGETIFVNLVAALGLVLLAALVGNMQRYLQSTSVRLEEWRLKRTETEQWMSHRQLPPELSQSVRKYDQYKWVATRGVEERSVIRSLPKDLQRKINRHLCLNLIRRVPLFDQMDDQMRDAICEKLKPALFTQDAYLFREGDPVKEILFIIRGHLDSYTTNGGRVGFFNSSRIGPGNFCGEELLTWALDHRPTSVLPSSSHTVKAISDQVEAFALMAEDLKSVALQFRRLHSKQFIQKFRFYSNQWRTWAACYIQAAWHRYKKCKELAQLFTSSADHNSGTFEDIDIFVPQPGSGLQVYAARLITNIRMGGSNRFGSDPGSFSSLEKPHDYEFHYMSDEE